MGLFDAKPNVATQTGSTTQNTNTTATGSTAPWAPSVPLWNGIMGNVGSLATRPAQGGADFGAGAAMTRQIAGTPGVTGDAISAARGYLSPDFASGMDPELQQYIDSLGSKASARAASMSAGMGHGAGSSPFADLVTRSFADATLPHVVSNLQNRRQMQMGVMGMAPGLDAARYGDAARMMDLADRRQQRQFANLNSALPFALGAGRMGGTTESTGSSNTVGSSSQETMTPGKSPITGVLGGALAGGKLFGPVGAIGGGILGGLM